MEEWKEVYGYDYLFEVSNQGRIRTKYYNNKGYQKDYREIIPLDNGHGYLRLNIKRNRKQITVYIHKLVAEYFIDNPNGYTEINHKDENKLNNSADNLEWCVHKYNANYGTAKYRRAEKARKRIRCIENGKVYASMSKAAADVNVGITAISNCLNGRSKSCAGYTWEYVDV